MTQRLDRFSLHGQGRKASADIAFEADDEGYVATQFMARADIAKAGSAWAASGLALVAQSLHSEVRHKIVLQGVLVLDRVQPTGARVRLAQARDGDVRGELSPLGAGPGLASCLTLSRCALAVLSSGARVN